MSFAIKSGTLWVLRALELRDAALKIVRCSGTWDDINVDPARLPNMRLLDASLGNLRISHRIPFQRLPELHARLKHVADRDGLIMPENLPYGLDVWALKEKVLDIEWDDSGSVELVTLRRGPWETGLIAAAKNQRWVEMPPQENECSPTSPAADNESR